MDGPLALDQLMQVWSVAYDIGHDVRTWWHPRKDGAGRTRTTSPQWLPKLIADDHAFLPARGAS